MAGATDQLAVIINSPEFSLKKVSRINYNCNIKNCFILYLHF